VFLSPGGELPIESVRAAGLEGVGAKRLDSAYEPGSRSSAWRKLRINQGQEFVIGGYTPSGMNFDALIFGCYEAARVHSTKHFR
jgi:bifunctional non-homologous end joining protein LigD